MKANLPFFEVDEGVILVDGVPFDPALHHEINNFVCSSSMDFPDEYGYDLKDHDEMWPRQYVQHQVAEYRASQRGRTQKRRDEPSGHPMDGFLLDTQSQNWLRDLALAAEAGRAIGLWKDGEPPCVGMSMVHQDSYESVWCFVLWLRGSEYAVTTQEPVIESPEVETFRVDVNLEKTRVTSIGRVIRAEESSDG